MASHTSTDYFLIPDITNEDEEFEVELTADLSYDDGSFSYAGTHCTHGQSGTYTPSGGGSFELDSDITWDKTKFTPEENILIEKYISEKEDDIVEDLGIKLSEEERSGYDEPDEDSFKD